MTPLDVAPWRWLDAHVRPFPPFGDQAVAAIITTAVMIWAVVVVVVWKPAALSVAENKFGEAGGAPAASIDGARKRDPTSRGERGRYVPPSVALTVGSVLVVSAIPLVGLLALGVNQRRLDVATQYLVSLAVGALLGGALLHLVPEALARLGPGPVVPLGVIGGFLGFFVLEKFLWIHAHDRNHRRGAPPLATLNVVGDALHNLIDGMVIAAAYAADTRLGVAATLAVLLHEVPQEMGDFGVLVYSGLPVRRAVLFNLVSGMTALAGALAIMIVGRLAEGFSTGLLPVAAGTFLYIAASDLVPELQRVRAVGASLRQIALMVLGVALMLLPAMME